ncbi:MAG TPA: rhomboid family intramembrane serine protease [Bryobacteraceae bacterium]|jgi:membrane associated rhomboid family serine protease
MAISTRSYARSYLGGSGLPPAIKWLLIANTAMFLALFFVRGGIAAIFTALALVPREVVHSFAVWQLGTYMFLHVGVLSFVFNMLALWMFGRELEESWGTIRFLQFYFLCGCGAAVFVIAASYLFGSAGEPVIGSVGAIYGILAASAALWPEREVLFIFFPMKMKWFVLLIAAIDFLVSYGSPGQVALLTGLLFGFFYVKSPARQRGRGRGPSPIESLKGQYQAWKIRRAKKKFQVYLRKQNSGRDDIIN